jgi:bifunctional DNA-binding transcriptional regulator/antitoxin component of YhaV-PrlF toxin-antitoxin module
MSNTPGRDNTRYEIITQEDESGDMIIPIPITVLEQLGWKEGDNVDIGVDENNQLFLRKTNK